jgi:lipid-A-disaccharide synthase
MDKLVVKELIQADYTPQTVESELELLMQDKAYRNTMLNNYEQLDDRMGKPGASAKTAALIVKYITKQ